MKYKSVATPTYTFPFSALDSITGDPLRTAVLLTCCKKSVNLESVQALEKEDKPCCPFCKKEPLEYLENSTLRDLVQELESSPQAHPYLPSTQSLNSQDYDHLDKPGSLLIKALDKLIEAYETSKQSGNEKTHSSRSELLSYINDKFLPGLLTRPGMLGLRQRLIKAYLSLGEDQKAMQQLTLCLTYRSQNYAYFLSTLGVLYEHHNSFEAAQACFKLVVNLDPPLERNTVPHRDWLYTSYLGLCHYMKQKSSSKLDSTLASFKAILKEDSDSLVADKAHDPATKYLQLVAQFEKS